MTLDMETKFLNHKGWMDSPAEVVGGSCGHPPEEDLFRRTASECHTHHVEDLVLRTEEDLLREVLCEAKSTAGSGYDGNLMRFQWSLYI